MVEIAIMLYGISFAANPSFICLERALDTTKKWNLKHYLGNKFNAF